VSSTNTLGVKAGFISAASHGRARPAKSESATAPVPWRPSQASAAAGRKSEDIGIPGNQVLRAWLSYRSDP